MCKPCAPPIKFSRFQLVSGVIGPHSTMNKKRCGQIWPNFGPSVGHCVVFCQQNAPRYLEKWPAPGLHKALCKPCAAHGSAYRTRWDTRGMCMGLPHVYACSHTTYSDLVYTPYFCWPNYCEKMPLFGFERLTLSRC